MPDRRSPRLFGHGPSIPHACDVLQRTGAVAVAGCARLERPKSGRSRTLAWIAPVAVRTSPAACSRGASFASGLSDAESGRPRPMSGMALPLLLLA